MLLALAACAGHRPGGDALGAAWGSHGERVRVLAPAPGVTATLIFPPHVDPRSRVDLILYALPNGNSTAQTIGKKIADGVDWHFDIQHIGAQTRALRAAGLTNAIVVYLEADTKSWPEWRRVRGYPQANALIVRIVDQLTASIGDPANLDVTLAGHSGGGSFMFGFIEGRDFLPDWLARIAFLDAVYNFDASRHGDKLAAWLHADTRHTLVSLAYDDREIMLDGKKIVSDSGGTWRASHRLLDYLAGAPLAADTLGAFSRYHSSQIEILLHPNPQNRILHTEMIGEMNGFMHAMLVRRPAYDSGAAVLKPERAYSKWVEPDVENRAAAPTSVYRRQ